MNPINFTSPTQKLKEVLFKVELQNVYSNFRFPATLFDLPVSAHNHKAVVNQETGEILSIVSNNYNLITNEKAIEMGKQIFTQLYPHVNTTDLIPYKIVAPQSKASAHIDLISKNVDFSVWEQESWLPYLRCTNSYNRTYALSFEIGFVRKLCSNGVLFNKKTMKLKYLHSKDNKIEVQSDSKQIKNISDNFIDQCISLRNYQLPKQLIIPLVFQILNINLDMPDARQLTKKMNYLQNLIGDIKPLTDLYSNELGCNAYTVFNVATDLVSHQDQYKNLTGYYFNVRSYYSKPTDWMEDFSLELRNPKFDINSYSYKTIEKLNDLKKHTYFEWELN